MVVVVGGGGGHGGGQQQGVLHGGGGETVGGRGQAPLICTLSTHYLLSIYTLSTQYSVSIKGCHRGEQEAVLLCGVTVKDADNTSTI